MIDEHYRFLDLDNKTFYLFQSEGRQGKVMKAVAFTLDNDNLWNLGFGDLKNGKIDDSVITNNFDVPKVMRTIAKIIFDFIEQHPDKFVIIKPVDEKRKRLYNRIFQRHYEDIEPIFELIGIIGYHIEPYSKEKSYDFFVLKLKSD